MTLRAIPITSLAQVETLRRIRNRCKDGFSEHRSYISVAEQEVWWSQHQHDVMAWLYADDLDAPGPVVGFGLVRRDQLGRWITVVAVLPWCAGRGYGKEITHDIVMRAPGRVWATARKDNPAAVKLHIPEDWDVIDGPDARLVYFRGKYEHRVYA